MSKSRNNCKSYSYQQFIANIPIGKENAKTANEICEAIGINSGNSRRLVHKARSNGIPVLTSHDGIWISSDICEINRVIDSLEERALRIMEAADALKATRDAIVK